MGYLPGPLSLSVVSSGGTVSKPGVPSLLQMILYFLPISTPTWAVTEFESAFSR